MMAVVKVQLLQLLFPSDWETWNMLQISTQPPHLLLLHQRLHKKWLLPWHSIKRNLMFVVLGRAGWARFVEKEMLWKKKKKNMLRKKSAIICLIVYTVHYYMTDVTDQLTEVIDWTVHWKWHNWKQVFTIEILLVITMWFCWITQIMIIRGLSWEWFHWAFSIRLLSHQLASCVIKHVIDNSSLKRVYNTQKMCLVCFCCFFSLKKSLTKDI